MSYLGYRAIINGVTITEDMVAPGSFSSVSEKRQCGSWTDGNGIDHYTYYPTNQTTIKLSLRERTLAEQESWKNIFATTESVPVTYWDDMTCTYKTGTFRMARPEFKHITVNSGINYGETKIELEEY